MAGSTLADTTFLRGLSRARLREIVEAPADLPGLDARAFNIRTIQRNAARQLLEAMDEQRLERLASDQLGALVRSDFASMDHDGMAETALSLAKSLAARLDKEGKT